MSKIMEKLKKKRKENEKRMIPQGENANGTR